MAAFRFSDCGAPCRVAGARVLDRLGTGTRPAPHDALVASSADEANRGKAFGLEGSGDNAGAFLGPLVTVFFLYSLHVGIRSIFYVAVIPCQSARKFAPSSASNFDPFERRGLAVALGSSELVGIAEASRARVA